VIDALLEGYRLKHVDRAGWLRVGVAPAESVAAHSWGVSLLVLWFLPPDLDRQRALTYATLHDLAEARVGDITPHDGVPRAEKHRAESAAIDLLLAERPELAAAWRAYERQGDPEARFVRQLDRLDMALQAVAYHQAHGAEVREFVDSAASAIEHDALVAVLRALRRRLDGSPVGT